MSDLPISSTVRHEPVVADAIRKQREAMRQRYEREQAEARRREEQRRREALRQFRDTVSHDFIQLASQAKRWQADTKVANALRNAEQCSHETDTTEQLQQCQYACDRLRFAIDAAENRANQKHAADELARSRAANSEAKRNRPTQAELRLLSEQAAAVVSSLDAMASGLQEKWADLESARSSATMLQQRVTNVKASLDRPRTTVAPDASRAIERELAALEATTKELAGQWDQECERQALLIETKARVARAMERLGASPVEPGSMQFVGVGQAARVQIDQPDPDGPVSVAMTFPGLEGDHSTCRQHAQQIANEMATEGVVLSVEGESMSAAGKLDQHTRLLQRNKADRTAPQQRKACPHAT